MNSAKTVARCRPLWRGLLTRTASVAGILCCMSVPLAAQDEAVVEALASILAAEDARDFQPALFRRQLVAAEPLVRRTAAMAVGRIGDHEGTALLLPLLADPDSTVQPVAMFALGLLRDTAAVPAIVARFDGQAMSTETATEAITALARIGGTRAAAFFSSLLHGAPASALADRNPAIHQVVREAWRLGKDAPVSDLLPFVSDSAAALRIGAVYSLARLRPPAAREQLLGALEGDNALVKSYALRAFTKSYADSAGVEVSALLSILRRVANDANSGVRIQALRALSSFRAPKAGTIIAPFIDDPVANVQVQAASALGETGGPEAAARLARARAGRGTFALRREALRGLARVDTARFLHVSPSWCTSADWRERASAAEGWATFAPGRRAGKPDFFADRDGRVVAAALQAWLDGTQGADSALTSVARGLLSHRDAAVRSLAADALARAAVQSDVPALIAMYRGTLRDSFPEAATSALGALAAISKASDAGRQLVAREFLSVTQAPADYLIRRWAEDHWPEAAARWGPAYPITTGRTMEDYRGVARRYLVGPGPQRYPHVFIDTDQRGVLEIELLGPDAPLTVANFLRLVDRRFFDGNRWHRVVPNFVIQDGDPRGDGWGGPGGAIRDEINRHRYDARTLGMALSGPDTGSSQWFLTLSPQPHLDGTYTVFGRAVGNSAAISRITQGDLIRTIHQ